VLLGGAPARPALIERCLDRGVPVSPTYGTTETASQIATARPPELADAPDTVGRPLLMTSVTVVDERGRPLEAGETGELVVDGPTVTPGYYDDPAADEEAFCPQGFRTGDLGYRDEAGRLFVVGRRSERIVTGGETVDPTEVADAVRSLPGVADAAVVGLPDEAFGERVGALLEPEPGASPPTELRAALADRLASHKLPRTVAVGELPRTESGTVDREAVRERLLEA
jgi:O-succinylbenzoic acid--CoA ligase